jgi:redox-sensitive bicupin YhaK (pirin superfamily)
VRGLGLLDIKTIFGETAVRRKMKLKLVVQLVRRNDGEFERLPLDSQYLDVLGLPIHMVKIQVAAGRNLAVLVEAAVRNTILRLRGIDTLRDFMDRQRAAMQADVVSAARVGCSDRQFRRFCETPASLSLLTSGRPPSSTRFGRAPFVLQWASSPVRYRQPPCCILKVGVRP